MSDEYVDPYDRIDALEARVKRLQEAIDMALHRYEREDDLNGNRGFVRGEVAWAMADDLRQATRDPDPTGDDDDTK